MAFDTDATDLAAYAIHHTQKALSSLHESIGRGGSDWGDEDKPPSTDEQNVDLGKAKADLAKAAALIDQALGLVAAELA